MDPVKDDTFVIASRSSVDLVENLAIVSFLCFSIVSLDIGTYTIDCISFLFSLFHSFLFLSLRLRWLLLSTVLLLFILFFCQFILVLDLLHCTPNQMDKLEVVKRTQWKVPKRRKR